MEKAVKVKVALTAVWLTLAFIFSIVVGSEGYSGFTFSMFLVWMMVLALPAMIYWLGFWIWEDGYIFRALRIGRKANARKKKPVYFQRKGMEPEHPWRRMFARFADVVIFSFAAGMLVYLVAPDQAEKLFANEQIAGFVLLPLWIPFEALLLSLSGTTLGKYSFGIRVEANKGLRPSYPLAVGRSFGAYVKGLCLGLPIIYLVTMYFSYKNLKEGKRTAWDESAGTDVRYAPIRWWLILLIGLVVAGVLYRGHVNERDMKAVEAFTATAGQYPQAREAAIRTYFENVSAIIKNDFGEGMQNCIYIAAGCKGKIAVIRNHLTALQEAVEQTFNDAEIELAMMDASASLKKQMMDSFDRHGGKTKQALADYYAVEEKLIAKMTEVVRLLERNMFKLERNDGVLYFEDTQALQDYNTLMEEIADITREEQDVINRL